MFFLFQLPGILSEAGNIKIDKAWTFPSETWIYCVCVEYTHVPICTLTHTCLWEAAWDISRKNPELEWDGFVPSPRGPLGVPLVFLKSWIPLLFSRDNNEACPVCISGLVGSNAHKWESTQHTHRIVYSWTFIPCMWTQKCTVVCMSQKE